VATTDELLQNLTYLEKKSYKDVINIAIKEYNEKSVIFTMLSNSMIKRYNRSEALLKGFDTKYQSADATDSYIVFQSVLGNVGGKIPDLDKTNGIINILVYGDAKSQRESKRYVAELKKRNSLLTDLILTDFKKGKDSLQALLTKIP
jgi:hypothetical protein